MLFGNLVKRAFVSLYASLSQSPINPKCGLNFIIHYYIIYLDNIPNKKPHL